jgi:hypothetical protein
MSKLIEVHYSELHAARQRAEAVDSDWQAAAIEALLLPQVYARWQAVNARRYPTANVERHPGLHAPEHGTRRNESSGWSAYAGYTLGYGIPGVCWNSVRDDYYGHNAGTCWDGIRRETVHDFAYWLQVAEYLVSEGKPLYDSIPGMLAEDGFVFVNDR